MSVWVVDASVVVKWFVPEVHSEAAHRLLEQANEYFAPDLLFAETTNTVWKKIRRRELSLDEGKRLVGDINRIAVATVSSRVLAQDAHALANAVDRSVYDALYLTLAIRFKTRVITADDRLVAALRTFPELAAHVQHVRAFEA